MKTAEEIAREVTWTFVRRFGIPQPPTSSEDQHKDVVAIIAREIAAAEARGRVAGLREAVASLRRASIWADVHNICGPSPSDTAETFALAAELIASRADAIERGE